MKHSIILKFIAIVLCAAALLGAVGSGIGILVLVEGDLYRQSVDDLVELRRSDAAGNHAHLLAKRYAERNLGGCPDQLDFGRYGGWFEDQYGGVYGSRLIDADGTVLEDSVTDQLQSQGIRYVFPSDGTYRHILATIPDSQRQEEQPVEETIFVPQLGMNVDALGEATQEVYSLTVSFDPNSSEGVSAPRPLGVAGYQDDGSVLFVEQVPGTMGLSSTGPIYSVSFQNESGAVIYSKASLEPVGSVEYGENGFQVHIPAPQVVPEATSPIEIVQGTPIYQAVFYGQDGETVIEHLSGTQPIGSASIDPYGNLSFQLYVGSAALEDTSSVASLVLMDREGNILFGEAHPHSRAASAGSLVAGEDGYLFYSYAAPVAVEETIPVTTMPKTEELPETIPETTASAAETTVPETTAVPTEAAVPETTAPPTEATVPETTVPATEAAATAAVQEEMIGGKPLSEYTREVTSYYDSDLGEQVWVEYINVPMPEYTVEMYILPDSGRYEQSWEMLRILRTYRYDLAPMLGISLVLFAVLAVYLCCAAGHKAKTQEVRAGGLNTLPLDVYALGAGSLMVGIIAVIANGYDDLLRQSLEMACVLIPIAGYVCCVLFVGFCFAVAAQMKTANGYWLRNTLVYRCIAVGVKCLIWLEKWLVGKGFAGVWKLCGELFRLGKSLLRFGWNAGKELLRFALSILGRCWKVAQWLWELAKESTKLFFVWLGRMLKRFMDLLPLTWQWMLGGTVLLFLGAMVFANRRDGWGTLWLLVGLAMVLYLSHCFGLLLESTKRMGKGDLDSKVDDKLMVGCFEDFARDLNDLADVVVVAAQKQLKSERMKTELITNVSHDIKTPLTSIINYVDLLQKPHTEAEEKAYLEVLDRQSQRLKKLIEDLMEMSKASTGNMSTDIIRLDAVESVNQALGEFADKLEKAQLSPVFRHAEPEAFVMADGRLVWRVLSNLLGNAVKYAMPGTRLYIDLMNLEGKVVLSLKNISRDELNVDAEELMERFVRGDDARNTEGSGLGLNIAKSLMELQKGQLQLLVDGDLFKVTLIFPGA